MRVTFDSNTIDRVSRPERHPKDPSQSDYEKIRTAILAGQLTGFFGECIITLESIPRSDRAHVFGSTRLAIKPLQFRTGDDGSEIIEVTAVMEQARKPIHPENLARFHAAVKLGLRALRGPSRVAWMRLDDSGRTIFAYHDDHPEFLEMIGETTRLAAEIEMRGVGAAQAQALGKKFSARDGASEPWFQGLNRARDASDNNTVARAVAEWADGDTIAAHIGHRIDLFCTADQGKSNGNLTSILDAENRRWLEATYRMLFVTVTELADRI